MTPEVADRAGGRFPAEPVWTLAAIHLASMSILRESLPELAVLSTDDRMRANSVQLGFEVLPVTDG